MFLRNNYRLFQQFFTFILPGNRFIRGKIVNRTQQILHDGGDRSGQSDHKQDSERPFRINAEVILTTTPKSP